MADDKTGGVGERPPPGGATPPRAPSRGRVVPSVRGRAAGSLQWSQGMVPDPKRRCGGVVYPRVSARGIASQLSVSSESRTPPVLGLVHTLVSMDELE